MMFRTCLNSTIGLIALVAAVPALAADSLPPPAPVQVVDQTSSCLYGRFDVGGVFHERPDISLTAIGPGGGFGGGSLNAVGETIEDSVLFEAGFGCQLLDTFRVEIVGGARLEQSLSDPFGTLSADLQSFTGFANVYYDITNYAGWTPYIGGGIGLAYHRITDLVAPPDSSSGDEVDFAWNLQAGLSYDVSQQTKVDFGYRLTDLGKARSDGLVTMIVDDLMAHEFKVGVRFNFDAW